MSQKLYDVSLGGGELNVISATATVVQQWPFYCNMTTYTLGQAMVYITWAVAKKWHLYRKLLKPQKDYMPFIRIHYFTVRYN
jgi:ABC-type transport system substrate-binding protein